ncbi:hypothetical protein Btru_011011, partial [Bulinus truncatus]
PRTAKQIAVRWGIPIEELEQLCLEQLEVMSKKRIRRILCGEESCNISSSGTEDDTTDEDLPDQPSQQTTGITGELEDHQADSTSVRQEPMSRTARNDKFGNYTLLPPDCHKHSITITATLPCASLSLTLLVLFIQSSLLLKRRRGMYWQNRIPPLIVCYKSPQNACLRCCCLRCCQKRDPSSVCGQVEPPDSGEEAEDEEIQENYTSGSEDGELVRKEDQYDEGTEVKVKEEPQSGTEEDEEEAGDGDNEEEMEDVDDHIMASMQLGAEGVLPSIMMDQMELLELEMRARAIKAMLLSAHDDGD